MRRLPLLLPVLLLAACGGSSAPKVESAPPAHMSGYKGVAVDPPRTAPSIALRDAWGRRVTLRRGGYTLVTFLYTHCPDVCPLIAANLNASLRKIGARAHHVSVLAVSVDPKGDTPAAVRAYAKRMHLVPQFHYLVGTRAQLRRIWAAYDVVAAVQRARLVTHVAYTALVDPSGKERLIYDAQVHAADVVHDLRLLMSGHGASA